MFSIFFLECAILELLLSSMKMTAHFITSRLLIVVSFVFHLRDQTQYKNGDTGWKRPPVEQVLLV